MKTRIEDSGSGKKLVVTPDTIEVDIPLIRIATVDEISEYGQRWFEKGGARKILENEGYDLRGIRLTSFVLYTVKGSSIVYLTRDRTPDRSPRGTLEVALAGYINEDKPKFPFTITENRAVSRVINTCADLGYMVRMMERAE